MFKPGQLLRAVVLDSAALVVSIKHSLATDPIAQEHLKRLRRSQPHLAPVSDLWSLSKDGELLLFKGALYVPESCGHPPGRSSVPVMTIVWLVTGHRKDS